MSEKILLRDNLFTERHSGLSLVASRCRNCGKVSFPKTDLCVYCLGREMTEIELSHRGRLHSYTTTYTPVAHFSPPHSVGLIDTPEGPRIFAPLCGHPEDFHVGMEMELEIGTLWTEDDVEVVGFRYEPVAATADREAGQIHA